MFGHGCGPGAAKRVHVLGVGNAACTARAARLDHAGKAAGPGLEVCSGGWLKGLGAGQARVPGTGEQQPLVDAEAKYVRVGNRHAQSLSLPVPRDRRENGSFRFRSGNHDVQAFRLAKRPYGAKIPVPVAGRGQDATGHARFEQAASQ